MTFFTLLGLTAFIAVIFINILSVIFWMMKEITMEDFASTFNPIYIYKEADFNILRCVVCTALSHIFFMLPAIVYWSYRFFIVIKEKIKKKLKRNKKETVKRR